MDNLFIAMIVSLVVQGVKMLSKQYVSENWQTFFTLSFLILVSFLAAGFVYFMNLTGYWNTFLDIGIKAAGIWALLIKRIE